MDDAAKEAPAEPGAVDETLHRVNQTIDKIDRIVGNRNAVSTSHAIATAPQPAAPWHVWVCVGCAWLATLMAVYAVAKAGAASERMSDLRSDMNTEQVNRAIMSRWTAQEVTAIRSYITTGKLAPMNPPPAEKEKPQ
jgi:hypothetical protein